MEQTALDEFMKNLLYEFNNKNLLYEALSHSSFVNEQALTDMKDNERLEFLGDAVINLIIGHVLMKQYPDLKEGDLSRMRANLVNESRLAAIANTIDLGPYIQLGRGEIQTKGREKKSILADTLEAVIAAVYLDGGFDAAFKIIECHFKAHLSSIAAPTANLDYKSKVQEIVQGTQKVIPAYKVIHESGPDHDKTFCVQLTISEIQTEGIGKSKKLAEQDAARKALEILQINSTGNG